MMDRATALRKIKACLDRAKSSTFPNEAAIALRMAQSLMEQHGIDHPELQAVGIEEHWARSRATRRPPAYETRLANVVARMFSCDILFRNEWTGRTVAGGYAFMGTGHSAEVASYTFTVLSRQLTNARTEYADKYLKRYRKNKIAAADLFCMGWVGAVSAQVPAPALTDERRAAIDAYTAHTYGKTDKLATTRRELTNKKEATEHRFLGYLEGQKAKVNAGLGSDSQQQALLPM